MTSKDIGLLSPGVTLNTIEEIYQESSGREEMRIELFGDKKRSCFYYILSSR